MMETLEYIVSKYKLRPSKSAATEIPNIGREQLAELFGELGFKRGAEIGVESGEYSEVLCKAIPVVELYSIDAWKAYRGYRDHVNQVKIDGFYETALKRLAPYNCRLMRMFSMQAVKHFKDDSLDFVYIDGNHNFESVTNDIAEWSKKVRPGGIISGHDYVKYRRQNYVHVIQVVDGWTNAYKISPWFLAGTKQEGPGIVRDKARSWFWVQPERRTKFPEGFKQ
jgi:hypothetical protein